MAARAVTDFLKALSGSSTASSQECKRDSLASSEPRATVGVPLPQVDAPVVSALSATVFRNFLERLRTDAAADLSRRILANIKKLSDYMAFMMENTRAVDAVVPPERLEEDVSLAFQRLVSHTLSQCQVHPLWSEDVESSASASSSANVATTLGRPSVDTLTECIEKLVAAKTYIAAAACFQHVSKEADAALRARCHGLRLMVMPAHLGLPRCMLDACYDHTWSLLRGELGRLGGYHTPRDKLVCLCNCSRLLMGLLSACREREALEEALSSGEPPSTHGDVVGAAHAPSPRRRPATADDLLPAIVYVCMRLAPPSLVSELRYIRHLRGPDALRSEAGYHLTNFESAAQVLQDFGPDSLAYCPDELRAAWPSTFSEVTERELTAAEKTGADDSRAGFACLQSERVLSCLVPAPSVAAGQAGEDAFDAWYAAKEALVKDCTADTLTVAEVSVLLVEYRNLLQTARLLRAAASLPPGGPLDADADHT